jgi:hypothetical protein
MRSIGWIGGTMYSLTPRAISSRKRAMSLTAPMMMTLVPCSITCASRSRLCSMAGPCICVSRMSRLGLDCVAKRTTAASMPPSSTVISARAMRRSAAMAEMTSAISGRSQLAWMVMRGTGCSVVRVSSRESGAGT